MGKGIPLEKFSFTFILYPVLSVAVSTSLSAESLIIQPGAMLNKGTIINSNKGLSDMPCSQAGPQVEREMGKYPDYIFSRCLFFLFAHCVLYHHPSE